MRAVASTTIPVLSKIPVLSGHGIVKKFPGVVALNKVDFDIYAGEIHGLIGENGAGKTTSMHILAGAQQPTAGEILLDGQPVQFSDTSAALKQRISIVYQELQLIPNLREVLRIDSLSQRSEVGDRLLVNDVSLSVAAGEVLGIFGLMGAGRTELLESIFGLHPKTTSGSVTIQGDRCALRSPAAAMRHGIGLVPEDRKKQGLILGMSVENNISLSNIRLIESYALLNRRLEQRHAESHIDQFSIKTPSVRQRASALVGFSRCWYSY